MDNKLSLRFDPWITKNNFYICVEKVNDIIESDGHIIISNLLSIFKHYCNARPLIVNCNWSKNEYLNSKLQTDNTYELRNNDIVIYSTTFFLNDETDPVNHPEHYETNGIECFDAIKASQGDSAAVNFAVCNAFKYIWRNQHKGAQIQDLQKAVWYLNKAIDILEGE